jgi:hypothetical protein
MVSVHTPILNIMDAIWVSQGALAGYPPEQTRRVDEIVASQDPVALDYWTAKYVLYPIDQNERHHPDFAKIQSWLTAARTTIADRGGFDKRDRGILVTNPTLTESEMTVYAATPGSG